MNKLVKKLATGGTALAVIIVIMAAAYAGSWIVICGIIKLITMCFGLTFKWSVSTGIWLIMILLKAAFGTTVNTKK